MNNNKKKNNFNERNSKSNDECSPHKKLDTKIKSCITRATIMTATPAMPAMQATATTTTTQTEKTYTNAITKKKLVDASETSRQSFRLSKWLARPQVKICIKKVYHKENNKRSERSNNANNKNNTKYSQVNVRNQRSRTTMPQKWSLTARLLATSWPRSTTWQLLILSIFLLSIQSDNVRFATAAAATTTPTSNPYESTSPLQPNSASPQHVEITNKPPEMWTMPHELFDQNATTYNNEQIKRLNQTTTGGNVGGNGGGSGGIGVGNDSIFMRFAKRFSTGNELWDGIIRDCYRQPSFSCFQNNVYTYLNGALETGDVNITQRLKFYKNSLNYAETTEEPEEELDMQMSPTEASVEGRDETNDDEHLLRNEIPRVSGRAATIPETPIEEITTALYGKSIKFAMTHDIEIQLPEMLFDGSTFRISPRGFEGNGILAKLELIPKQEIQARLAGKILMNKIKKFFRSKLLLSFLALVLIIKIIKIKLFWLLPLIIGVGAAKKLLLKFLLFLFPALSHLFKLCSYYQQTYHSTKYHHHHHLIDHHHTIVPPWHNEAHHSIPEIIYTSPPKGHPSAYLHGAPIHETYGPVAFEHNEGNWESSGPGLGSDFIGDINRAAQVDDNTNYFKPHSNDANEIHAWGLAPTQTNSHQQQSAPSQLQQQQIRQRPQTQQQRPPISQQQQQQQLQLQKIKQQLQYQKPHSTSQNFNPFELNDDKQSIFSSKFKKPLSAQSAPRPVYTPPRGNAAQHVPPHPQAGHIGATTTANLGNGVNSFSSNAAQIVAQYEPSHGNPAQQQSISPELTAQLKEALRIQAEQRIIAQQQKILDHQPFVQDGQPLYPKNYDPFYSPILLKIDKIVEQLGVTDDLCKERLICSMYKDPSRYSPHSNFVSAELSRETSELQPVTSTNPAVLRFYRLIQAARDGQDQRDCLRIYSQCNVNTE